MYIGICKEWTTKKHINYNMLYIGLPLHSLHGNTYQWIFYNLARTDLRGELTPNSRPSHLLERR